MKTTKFYITLFASTALLGACQTTGSSPTPEQSNTPSKAERMDKAIEKATIKAAQKGSVPAALSTLEKQYKRDSSNPQIALQYAQALRHSGYLNRSELILSPFAKENDPAPGINTEMSMIELGLGNYDSAENYAQKAVIQNPTDHLAYQNLGITLDAKEMHPEAERAFRKGLEHWEGNPTTIMNNLALNLATQGFIDEAIEVLEKAKKISPDRIELERNLRIIRTLNER